MHRLSVLVLSLSLLAQPASAATRNRDVDPAASDRAAGREVILDPQHVLTPAEQSALATEGAKVLAPLPNGRYLVRLSPGATLDATDPRVRSVEAIDPESKIDRRVWSELRGRAFGRLQVFFHNDVNIDEARDAIAAVGGSLRNPLATDFVPSRYLVAQLPANSLGTLAADGRVRTIRAQLNLKARPDNATSAAASKVNEIQAAPYGLSGQGVALSFHELGSAFNHTDFGGRFTAHFTGGADITHATHVAGTIIGSGAGNAQAKGMSPSATLHEFQVSDPDEYLESKLVELPKYNVVADNNSWGYTLAWEFNGQWVWWDGDIYHGAYVPGYTSALDEVARENPILFVHSAGNDGDDTGPLTAPYLHKHTDQNNNVRTENFCYSENGTGTDCAAPCTTGPQFCEVLRHTTTAPFGVIGLMAGAKNVIAVGATDSSRNITSYSSRGPAKDGRVKPDVVARGGIGTQSGQVISTWTNNTYAGLQGTSMSTPVVTGIAGLLTEQYRKTNSGATPNGTILKAVIIAGTDDLYTPGPDYTSGHGFVNARTSTDLIIADASQNKKIRSFEARQGDTFEVPVTVDNAGKLRVVLVWPDPEVIFLDEEDIDEPALVNDLDLEIVDSSSNTTLPWVLDKSRPTGAATRGINHLDNVEVVQIDNAAPGNYTAKIRAQIRDTEDARQPFTVVVNGGTFGATPPPPCVDVQEPNDTSATAYGELVPHQQVNARVCSQADLDFYRFTVKEAGLVTLKVTAAGSPVKVTIERVGGSSTTQIVGAGQTVTMSTTSPAGTSNFIVKVESEGTVSTSNSYTITPVFEYEVPVRRRATRR